MIVFDRPVRFEDVDAAGIVYFANFFSYAHDAMDHFFGGLPGGYAGLIVGRKIGFPAVQAHSDFRAPLRFGDVARIATTVPKVGRSSVSFHYEMSRASDGVLSAVVDLVNVSTDLTALKSVPLPDDVRALLEAHAS